MHDLALMCKKNMHAEVYTCVPGCSENLTNHMRELLLSGIALNFAEEVYISNPTSDIGCLTKTFYPTDTG